MKSLNTRRSLFGFLVAVFMCSAHAELVSKTSHVFLPTDSSNGRDFYVFGPKASKGLGAEDSVQVLFFRFKATTKEDIYISVFDPDASGANDSAYLGNVFGRNTTTSFAVYGGNGAYTRLNTKESVTETEQAGTKLADKSFTKEYNNDWYHFGPFKVTDGEMVNNWSYFKIVVHAKTGGLENGFRLAASPKATGQGFAYKMSLSMQHKIGLKTEFFVEIPHGMTKLEEMNYDIDFTGGSVYVETKRRTFKLSPSRSGKWMRNRLELLQEEAGDRAIYRFVKGPQKRTNMTFMFLDANGQPLRLFSGDGAVEVESRPMMQARIEPQPPEPEEKVEIPEDRKCLAFLFDASKSFDPDNQNLSYSWDFGDGKKSNRIRTTHLYDKPGEYEVVLVVNDGSQADCAIAEAKKTVVANLRPKAVAEVTEQLVVGQAGKFDGSKSSDTPGDILTHAWDYGDGTQGKAEITDHAYQKGGTYTAKLTVTDDKNSRCSSDTDTKIVRVNTPPVADAGKDQFVSETDPTKPFVVTLDGSGSTDADGDKLSYLWDFGDGEKGEGMRVTHTYPKGGTYTAKLTVNDNSGLPGDTDDDEAQIVLNRAPTAIAGGPRVGCANEEIRFDGTRSVDLDGDGLAYLWDFGDGKEGNGATPTHLYEKAGTYTVKLTVDDGRGTNISRHTATQTVTIIEAPVATIKPVGHSAVAQAVTFEADTSKNDANRKLTYVWEFGDEAKAEGTKVTHTYAKGGAFNVKLTVADGSGLDCGQASSVMTMQVNTPPTPSLIIANKICCVGQEVSFDGSGSKDLDGDKLKYLWDFGDENTSEEIKPTHIYKTAGVFKITLTVSDTSGLPGSSAQASAIAKVNQKPVAAFTVEQK